MVHTVPSHVPFVIPEHYHQTHDEYISVGSGRMIVTLDGVESELTPEKGEVFVKRGVRHTMRKVEGEELIFRERTGNEETDLNKLVFFRNVFPPNARFNMLEFFAASYKGDCYPSLPGHVSAFESFFVAVAGGWVAHYLGYRKTVSKEQIKAYRS
ncbi:hypothetical protein MNV49_006403 [Pseudohyphozyma bogoriensis]|nr:hypothetical protein MNV49_006403 [Pseudohyphozyma bogoriensis]